MRGVLLSPQPKQPRFNQSVRLSTKPWRVLSAKTPNLGHRVFSLIQLRLLTTGTGIAGCSWTLKLPQRTMFFGDLTWGGASTLMPDERLVGLKYGSGIVIWIDDFL